jgi:hypothetical protein
VQAHAFAEFDTRERILDHPQQQNAYNRRPSF